MPKTLSIHLQCKCIHGLKKKAQVSSYAFNIRHIIGFGVVLSFASGSLYHLPSGMLQMSQINYHKNLNGGFGLIYIQFCLSAYKSKIYEKPYNYAYSLESQQMNIKHMDRLRSVNGCNSKINHIMFKNLIQIVEYKLVESVRIKSPQLR